MVDFQSSDLIARLTEASNVYALISEDRSKLLDAARIAQSDLARLAVELASIEVPMIEAPDKIPENLADAELIAERWERRKMAHQEIIALAEKRLEALESFRILALRVVDETSILETSASQLRPLLSSLTFRERAGEVIELPGEPVDLSGLDAGVLASETAVWRLDAQRVELDQERTKALAENIRLAAKSDEAAIARAQRWLHEARTRENLVESFGELPIGDVISEFMGLVTVFEADYRAFETSYAEFTARENEIAQLEIRLESLVPVEADEERSALDSSGVALASLQEARRAVTLGEAVVTYLQASRALVGDLRAALTETIPAATELDGLADEIVSDATALDVLARLQQERAARLDVVLPQEATDDRFARQLENARNIQSVLAGTRAALALRMDELDHRAASIQTDLIDARRAVSDHRERLEAEEQWLVFAEDLEDLEGQALIDAFADADEEYRKHRAELPKMDRSINEFREQLSDIANELTNVVDPVVLTAQGEDDKFEDWLSANSLRREPDPSQPAPPAEDSEAGVAATDPAVDPESPATEPDTSETTDVDPAGVWVDELRDLRDRTVIRRQGFYEEIREKRQDWAAQLREIEVQLTELNSQSTVFLESMRKARAAAVLIRSQVLNGTIAEDREPEQVPSWMGRDALDLAAEFDGRVAEVTELLDDVRTRLDALSAFNALIAPLNDWHGLLNHEVEQLGDYILLRNAHEALSDLDGLDPLQRREIEAELNQRIANDLGIQQILSNYFASSETEIIDELMARFYQRLVVSERRIANLEQRSALLDAVVEGTDATREVLEELQTSASEVRAQLDTTLAIELALVKAAIDPLNATETLAAAAEATGATLTLTDVPQLPTTGEAADIRNARNALINSLKDDWAGVHSYDEWTAQLSAAVAPLGELDQRVDGYKDLISQLDATREDVQRTIARLLGHSGTELTNLSTEKTLSPEEQERLAIGEIGILKAQREGAINDNAWVSLTRLVVIPFVALLVVLFSRIIGRVAVARISRKEEQNPGTRSRASTLNGIVQFIVTVAAIALAAIYMLQSINVDVGPLIASFGIFGLAVAFGAQSTLRDVFAGFFLLIERQLNVGDWVIVNEKVGMVESVGLRLTTIRDWHSGGLNYISNGDVNSVMNWCRGSENNPMIGGQTNNAGVGNSWVRFYVTLDSDPDQVVQILRDVAEEFKTDKVHGHKVNDIWVDPGVNDIKYGERCFEFRVLCLGSISIWGASRVYRGRAVKALLAAGIALPENRFKLTDVPPIEMMTVPGMPSVSGQ